MYVEYADLGFFEGVSESEVDLARELTNPGIGVWGGGGTTS